jgi:hypothetical protein
MTEPRAVQGCTGILGRHFNAYFPLIVWATPLLVPVELLCRPDDFEGILWSEVYGGDSGDVAPLEDFW